MRLTIFFSVALIIAVTTIVIGLGLIGAPAWHFTILDVVTDILVGVVFGIIAQSLATYWIGSRVRFLILTVVALVVAGILSVIIIEGGAASALIFGS